MIRKIISNPIISDPKIGNRKIGLIPSNERGIQLNAIFNTWIIPPAKNPATNAPKNPEGVYANKSLFRPKILGSAKIPPIIPTMNPGRSAIERPMNPARIGNIILNEILPK